MVSDWLQVPGNTQAYERLCTLIASGKTIAFVGAGASAGLYPLWPELIRQLADAAVQGDYRNEENRDYWLKADPQDAVDQIRNSLRGTYRDKIRKIFAPPAGKDDNRYTEIHAALISLPFRGFVTTNYDTALHEARQRLRPELPFAGPVTWKDEDDVRRWLTDQIFDENPCPILSAHGYWGRGDTIVLGSEDYREAYNTDPYASLFKHLWGACQLVFVGFGFNDPWLKFLGGETITRSGARGGAPQHLAISGLRELDAIPARQQTFRNTYNADPLFYPVSIGPDGEDHSALLAILQSLATQTGGSPSGHPGGATKGGSRKPRKHIKPAAPQPKGRSQATATRVAPAAELLERSSGWDINNAHRRITETALCQTPELFSALWRYLQVFFPDSAIAQTKTAIVEHFAKVNSSEDITNCFFSVRRALREVHKILTDRHVIRRSEIAASYLYCLAAHSLVNNLEHESCITRLGLNRSVVLVPDKTNVLCAIIITALCGGKVHLLPDEEVRAVEDRRLPRADYVFELRRF